MPALWVPAMMNAQAARIEPEWDRLLDRRAVWMHVFGRLKPGVTAEQAKAGAPALVHVDARGRYAAGGLSERDRGAAPQLSGVDDRRAARAAQGRSDLRGTLERPLWVLMGGTLLLLLLASLNVASLFLARGAARSRELTTRMALGASRGRITGQLLVESMLIALGGGLLGLLAAPAVSQALLSFLSQDAISASRWTTVSFCSPFWSAW